MKARVFKHFVLCAVLIVPFSMSVLKADVPLQPFMEQVRRLNETLEFLGIPLSGSREQDLKDALQRKDISDVESILNPLTLFTVEINPESRVKVQRGGAEPILSQGGYTPFLVKVINQGTVTARLNVTSPQAGQRFGGMTPLSARRMQRETKQELKDPVGDPTRFLDLSFYEKPPMTTHLSGLEMEYKLLWIYATDPGSLEATIAFDVGQGTQDIGFRAEVPVLFKVKPATRVTMNIRDVDGKPSTARLVFRDSSGHVFPPQAKRLAPDFYF